MLAAILFIAMPAFTGASPVSVTTWRYDNTRAGENISETVLTPANVRNETFGKVFSYAVDGYVYAQPLYVSGLNIGGKVHNVLFVATEHDSVYALDADQNQQLWMASLLDTAHGAATGATTVPSANLGTNDIVPEIGITGTPVIDTATNTLYVVSQTLEKGAYVNRLHALNLLTGNEAAGSPVVINGSVAGKGTGSVNGVVPFNPEWELNRTGLLFFEDHVFVAFGAHGDNGPYHGWLFSFDTAPLRQTALFNTSPNGRGNGIWHSGAAPAADVVNGVPRLFFVTGNFFSTGTGSPNPTYPYTGSQNYSNALVRMDVTNGALQVSDEWTPYNQEELSDSDEDQTSGGILLLPDQAGGTIHELIQVGKNGRIEVLDRDDLGGFNNSYNNVAQEINGQIKGLWSTPAYWNGNVYFWGNGDTLKQFSLKNGALSKAPTAKATVVSAFPGASPVISSNGTTNGILWAVRSDGYRTNAPAILYAYNPQNVGAAPYYASTENAARDSAGRAVKFVVPVVTNGKVYVGAQKEVDVYGLLATTQPAVPAPALKPVPGNYASSQSITLSDAQAGATIYYTTDGTSPSSKSLRYTQPISVKATGTIQAIAVASGYSNSGVSGGTYTIGTPPTINFSNGFASAKGLTLNGSAVNSDDSRLQLTTGKINQAGSVFWNSRVNVQTFVTDFTFQLSGTPPLADGITFTIQGESANALGTPGGGLGYGSNTATVKNSGIRASVAVKFDLYSNLGEGTNSTGLYINGALPATPAIDLTSSHVVLGSGDTLSAHVTYDGQTLTLTIKDPVNGGTYTGKFAIDIPTTVGSTTAYVGFTGGTGGKFASQKILTWTLTSQP
jgi:hypothetical protein